MNRKDLFVNKQRCSRFWNRQETDRPLIASWIGNFEVGYNYRTGLSRLKPGLLEPCDIKYADFREDYENLFTAHSQINEDIPWAAFPLMVFPWAEAILGCPVYNKDGNIQAEHGSAGYDDILSGRKFRREWLETLLGFIDWLNKLSNGRFPVAMSLMRGPADLLSVLRGSEQSIFDIYDQPDLVKDALNTITESWKTIAGEQQKHLVSYKDGFSFSLQTLWAEERCGWFQDDALSYWSPELYRQFVLPCEHNLASVFPVTGIHLHSGALFTVEDLVMAESLNVIEVNLDDYGMTIAEMIPWFEKILQKKRLYVLGNLSDNDLKLMCEKLPAAGLALQVTGMTAADINSRIDTISSIWSEKSD